MALAAPRMRADGTDGRTRLLEIIRKKSLLRGTFKLVSGATSDYYLDMKPTTFDPEGATLIAQIICDILEGDTDVASIGGLELGAVPIVAAVCAESFRRRPVNGFVVRKEKRARHRSEDRRQLQAQHHSGADRGRHHQGRLGDAGRQRGAGAGRDREEDHHHRGSPGRR
jgi:hypothetical protein